MSDIEDDDFEEMSSSSDEEIEMPFGQPREKNLNFLEEVVPRYDHKTFFEHFRLSRGAVADVVERFANSNFYKPHSGLYGNISAHDQVLITLWYIGHQTVSFVDVADRFNITISSLYRILRRVIICISNISPQIILWPTQEERNISQHYFAINGFPGAVAAIDGTHIKIKKPQNDADSYINRKGYYSIQMQAVCDYRRKIIDVFIGYPGSVHDSRVFRNSPLYHSLEEKCGNMFILGDSAYPLKRNLMTPFKNRGNLTRRQINYNLAHARNRYIIEHTFGVLKQKFRQLYHTNLTSIPFIAHLIRAACVLHNIALEDEVNLEVVLPEQPPQLLPELDSDEEDDDNGNAQEFRNNLMRNLPM